MPIVRLDKPSTPREHEILALANLIVKTTQGHTCDIVLASIAQAFLAVLRHLQDTPGIPPYPGAFIDAAEALTEVVENVRSLPDETVQ